MSRLTSSQVMSRNWLDSVRAASTANVDIATLAAGDTIDDVVLVAGDRVLLKDQDDDTENGIYVVPQSAGGAKRAGDYNKSNEIKPSNTIPVEEGTENGDSGWMLATDAPITLNTTGLMYINVITEMVGGIIGSGTTNKVAKFTGASTVGDSSISDDGTTATIAANVAFDYDKLITWYLGPTPQTSLGFSPPSQGIQMLNGLNTADVICEIARSGTADNRVQDGDAAQEVHLYTTKGGHGASTGPGYGSDGGPFTIHLGDGGDARVGSGSTGGYGASMKIVMGLAGLGDGAGADGEVGTLLLEYPDVTLEFPREAPGGNGYVLTAQTDGTLSWAAVIGGVTSDADENTLGGTNALDSLTAGQGTNNTAFGFNALTAVTTADNNTALGHSAGMSTNSNAGVFIGFEAGKLVTGTSNTIVGAHAGDSLTTGSNNVFVGVASGGAAAATSMSECTFVGRGSGQVNTADANTFIGYQCGSANTSGTGQCFAGHNAGANVTGNDNTIFGADAGDSFTTGTNNTLIGRNAGGAAGATTMSNCTFVGKDAGLVNTANQNTFIGSQAGDAVNGGSNNTACGYNALTSNVSAASCAAFGANALNGCTGAGNTGCGAQAGEAVTTGTNNTFIGFNADTSLNSVTASIALGKDATVTASNQMVVGANSNTVSDVYIGNGVTNASPGSFTLNATGGSGANIAGAALVLAGGKPTGNALAGDVVLKYGLQNGTSDSTLRGLSTQTYRVNSTLLTQYSHPGKAASVISTTETSVLDGTSRGTKSIEGGVWTPGRFLRIKTNGLMTTSGRPPTYRVRMYKGTNVFFDTGAITPTPNMTLALWEIECTISPRTLTASAQGTAAAGTLKITNPATGALLSYKTTQTSPVIDTTTTEDIDVTITFGANTPGNSFNTHYTTVEWVN